MMGVRNICSKGVLLSSGNSCLASSKDNMFRKILMLSAVSCNHHHQSLRYKSSSSSGVTRYSNLFVPTWNNFNNDPKTSNTVSLSQKLLLSQGYIAAHSQSQGSYSLLTYAMRSLEKLIKVIDEEMKSINAQKIMMPCLIHNSLLKRSGRWEELQPHIFPVKNEFLLAPTHEEVVSQILASIPSSSALLSYKRGPLLLYQIGNKYRYERRPKSGLMRCREFLMKDMYSFDVDDETAVRTYQMVNCAYERLFQRLELPVIKVEADPGNMGGYLSHEYHLLSESGQDMIVICSNCSYAMNIELLEKIEQEQQKDDMNDAQTDDTTKSNQNHIRKSDENAIHAANDDHEKSSDGNFMRKKDGHDTSGKDGNHQKKPLKCPKCHEELFHSRSATSESDKMNQKRMEAKKGIELGHTFLLGTRYSIPFDLMGHTKSGGRMPLHMGCYGIGVTRLLAAALESLSLPIDTGIMRWPRLMVPFDVMIIPPKDGSKEESIIGKDFMMDMAVDLKKRYPNLDVAIDDRRDLTIGRRAKEHLFNGVPHMVIGGRGVSEDVPKFEVSSLYDDEKLLHPKSDEKPGYGRSLMSHLQVMDYFNSISTDLSIR